MRTFNEWFDQEYPVEKFTAGTQIIRLSLKEVAEKAYLEGLTVGYSSQFDSELSRKIEDLIS